MPKTIKHVEDRVIALKLVIEIMNNFSSAYFQGRRMGACADDIILYAAVIVGQAEGHPMNASKLAEFADMPRPTVIRKLLKFEHLGVVERHGFTFRARLDLVNSDGAVLAIKRTRQLIVNAAVKLSKVDTKPIAPRTGLAV